MEPDWTNNQDSEINTDIDTDKSGGKTSGMATAAICFGIAAFLLCLTGFLPIPVGALSILFAILSVRRGEKMSIPAKAGIVASVLGMILGIVFFVQAVTTIFTDSSMRDLFLQIFNESMKETYGSSAPEIESFDDLDSLLRQIDEAYEGGNSL